MSVRSASVFGGGGSSGGGSGGGASNTTLVHADAPIEVFNLLSGSPIAMVSLDNGYWKIQTDQDIKLIPPSAGPSPDQYDLVRAGAEYWIYVNSGFVFNIELIGSTDATVRMIPFDIWELPAPVNIL